MGSGSPDVFVKSGALYHKFCHTHVQAFGIFDRTVAPGYKFVTLARRRKGFA